MNRTPITISCGKGLIDHAGLRIVRDIIKSGGVIVYPTETLYGLGADPMNRRAVMDAFTIKERPTAQGVSVAFLSLEQAEGWVAVPPEAKRLLERHAPGPITVLVPSKMFFETGLPESPMFGIRIPCHPVARQIIGACGPIVSTSANRHGHPPDAEEAVLVGESCGAVILADGVRGEGSAVVSVDGEDINIIRPGPMNME